MAKPKAKKSPPKKATEPTTKPKIHVPYSGPTTLHSICKKGNVNLLKAALKKYPELLNSMEKFNVTVEGNETMTPLHVGAYTCNLNVVETLLKHGADVNAKDSDGTTALHVACCLGNLDLIRLLIKFNVDINDTDVSTLNSTVFQKMTNWENIFFNHSVQKKNVV